MKKEIEEIQLYLERLFPLHRSLTGAGNRETFRVLQEIVTNLKTVEIKSGKRVFDWIIPPEWSVTEAYVKNKNGKKIIDIKDNNLHLLSYSKSYVGTCSANQLKKHLYTIPSKPNWIPYRTSYYNMNWGFCAKHSIYDSEDFIEPFEVVIKSNHNKNGLFTYAEALKKGEFDDEKF